MNKAHYTQRSANPVYKKRVDKMLRMRMGFFRIHTFKPHQNLHLNRISIKPLNIPHFHHSYYKVKHTYKYNNMHFFTRSMYKVQCNNRYKTNGKSSTAVLPLYQTQLRT